LVISGIYFYNYKSNKLNIQASTDILGDSTIQVVSSPQQTQVPTSTVASDPATASTDVKGSQNYSEGWIGVDNGITGWAFDDSKDYQVALTFQSVNNPSYSFTATSNSSIFNDPAHDAQGGYFQDGSFMWTSRSDAANELKSQGIQATSVIGFQFSPGGYAETNPSVPKDDYILIKATYNGKLFKLPADTSTHTYRVCAYGQENYYQCYN
jgi:hypothetical protein